jgi:hypothetical protein
MQDKIEKLSRELDELLGQEPKDHGVITSRTIIANWFFGFVEGYAQWRNKYPLLTEIVSVLRYMLYAFLFFAFMWWMAGTAAGKLTGLEGVRNRVVFAYYSVVWLSKGVPNVDELQMPPKRFSGTIEKIVDDLLVISYHDKGKSVRRLVRPANVILANREGFAEWAEPYLLKGVVVDFYKPTDRASGHDVWSVVIWSEQVPINVKIVELGYGAPETNSETVIVNGVFARYYAKRARSG